MPDLGSTSSSGRAIRVIIVKHDLLTLQLLLELDVAFPNSQLYVNHMKLLARVPDRADHRQFA